MPAAVQVAQPAPATAIRFDPVSIRRRNDAPPIVNAPAYDHEQPVSGIVATPFGSAASAAASSAASTLCASGIASIGLALHPNTTMTSASVLMSSGRHSRARPLVKVSYVSSVLLAQRCRATSRATRALRARGRADRTS